MKRLALLAALTACTSEKSAGIQVNVVAAQQSMPTSVQNASGVTVQTSSSFVNVAAVDIGQCSSAAARLWRLVNPLPSAFAHTENSPFHLGTPDIVSLAGERPEATIGTIAPPPGDYCSVSLEINPADPDALNIDLAPAIVGNTYVAQGTANASPYSATTDAADNIVLPIDRLTLSDEHPDATLTISVDTSHAYDGIDFTSPTLATDLLLGLRTAWSVSVN